MRTGPSGPRSAAQATHGRLGRPATHVPHLALAGSVTLGERGGTGLATEDGGAAPGRGRSAGREAGEVGTVDTTVMPCAEPRPRSRSCGPASAAPGTRQAPLRHASHISSHEASNATDRPASTWISRTERLRLSRPGTAALRRRRTPLPAPVGDGYALGHARGPRGEDDPGIVVGGWGRAGPAAGPTGGRDRRPVGEHRGDAGLPENTRGARSSGSSASRHVRRPRPEATARIPRYRSLVPEVIRTPTRSPRRPRPRALDQVDHGADQVAVRQHRGAVVDRRLVAVLKRPWPAGGPRGSARAVRRRPAAARTSRPQPSITEPPRRGWPSGGREVNVRFAGAPQASCR